jgi:hypothetical protein
MINYRQCYDIINIKSAAKTNFSRQLYELILILSDYDILYKKHLSFFDNLNLKTIEFISKPFLNQKSE